MPQKRRLHQFPISHYCEKTRWHLDRKGLAYEVRNLLPGVHAVVNRLSTGKKSVPVLVDGERAVADSTEIALYLERTYPERPLLPPGGEERARTLELEEFFDDGFGPSVRRFVYAHALATPGLVPRLFFDQYSPLQRAFEGVLGGPLQLAIRRMYRIDPAAPREARAVVEQGVERLEREIAGDPDRYLVGRELTLADVTAASLLAPLIAPPGSPWAELDGVPSAVVELRGELRARAAGEWVLRRYARDRRAPS